MKKILVVFICMLMVGKVFAISDWRQGSNTAPIEGTANPSDIDTNSENYAFAPLDKILTNQIRGCTLTWASNATITVGTGEVTCSNGAGTIKRMRQNTATTTLNMGVVGVGGIDSGSAEAASTWYSVYAVADASTTTFTVICASQGTALSDVTYYRYIGSVYNNASSNLDNFTWVGNGEDIIYMWDIPVTLSTTVSAGAWTDGSTQAKGNCSLGIPSSSTMGIFGLHSGNGAGGAAYVSIRPNGSTWITTVVGGVGSVSTNGGYSSGQRMCATDSSQKINIYHSAAVTETVITIEGFYLKR